MIGQFINRLSLRQITFIGGILTAVIPVLVLGVTSALAVRSMTLNDLLQRDLTAATGLASDLDNFLLQREMNVADLAEQISALPALDPETVTAMLERTRRNYPDIDTVNMTDTAGNIVAQASDTPTGAATSLADRAYWQDAVRTMRPVISPEVIIGRTTGRPLVLGAAPVRDRAGNLRGVVVMSSNAARLVDMLGRYQEGITGHAVVASASGIVVAHESLEVIAGRMDYSGLPIWPLVNAGDSGPLANYTDENGAARTGAYATVPRVGWKVWISQTLGQVNDQIWQAYEDSLGWVVLVLVLAVVGAFALTRILVRPIEHLSGVARQVAAGAYGSRAREDGPRELAALAHDLNAMSVALETNIEAERGAKGKLERAVAEYAAFASRVAAGDLAARAALADDGDLAALGTSLNQMAQSLERLVGEVRSASGHLASAAAEILAATTQQASAATERSSAVRETAATVMQVRKTAEVSVSKTRLVAEQAQQVAATAESGRQAVEENIRGSESARARMEALAERIVAFSELAQAISDINTSVADLADQSNLLSVNAGIEAAKAGDAGRGFAVVASEVKTLAERSREATGQVRRIIAEFQKSAQAAVMAAEQGVKAAESGMVLARRSGEAIGGLSDSVTDASEAARQILASAEQQEIGMGQIVDAMRSFEQTSAQTVAATQQVERAAADLNRLARTLTGLIGSFSNAELKGAD